MLKKFYPFLLGLCAALVLTACDENDEPVTPTYHSVTAEAVVVNQGNYYSGVAGTLASLDFSTATLTDGIFQAANDQSLGDTPQNAVFHGSKLYVAVYASNLVWVLDAKTKRIVQQVETQSPEWVTASGAYVYVANNDGYVTRIDTATYARDTVSVGPNPAGMDVATDGCLYVSISDGYNYTAGYANGLRVAKVNLATFTKEADFAVGLNPGKVVADGAGNVFVVCNGDYYTVLPKVYKIDTQAGEVSAYAEGNQIDVNRAENRLYVLNTTTDWNTGASTTTYAAYDTRTDAEQSVSFAQAADLPSAPTGVFVDQTSGHVFVTSDRGAFGYASQGDVYEFDADGTFRHKYAAGIHPYAMAFRYEVSAE